MKVLGPITNLADVTNKEFVQDSGADLIDIIYPVGTMYTTTDTTFNPNTAWGGTWEQLTSDAYLKIVTSNAGTVAGTTDHKIAVANMPSHTHTFTGSSATTASQSTSTTGNQSQGHTHSGTVGSAGAHTHNVSNGSKWATFAAGSTANVYVMVTSDSTNIDGSNKTVATNSKGSHTHDFTTGGISANHTHSYSHTHTLVANGSNSNTGSGTAYYPGYYGVIAWHRIA